MILLFDLEIFQGSLFNQFPGFLVFPGVPVGAGLSWMYPGEYPQMDKLNSQGYGWIINIIHKTIKWAVCQRIIAICTIDI